MIITTIIFVVLYNFIENYYNGINNKEINILLTILIALYVFINIRLALL